MVNLYACMCTCVCGHLLVSLETCISVCGLCCFNKGYASLPTFLFNSFFDQFWSLFFAPENAYSVNLSVKYNINSLFLHGWFLLNPGSIEWSGMSNVSLVSTVAFGGGEEFCCRWIESVCARRLLVERVIGWCTEFVLPSTCGTNDITAREKQSQNRYIASWLIT